ncbi:MAG: bifunctional proline dehydrogenase/L-glutamate gamma-semialdehyde dehydrogenase PutA [Devosiaceae bacterium]|nr:bifunctional proline dehydrogenase/L-glutamate gamma-semialdehyde dehydrogenase PutA [Devosiaceae bacterium]
MSKTIQSGSFKCNPLPDEGAVLRQLVADAELDHAARAEISITAAKLVEKIRNSARPGLMESFLAEYGLSTNEGVALMCLAEALLRVPDIITIDALIEDKIAPSNWRKHLGHSTSALVNASTWGLMLTGKVLENGEAGLVGTMRAVTRRLGEPVIRTAVAAAMREMGHQFVLGQNISDALKNAREYEEKGFTYSYDMLGEAATTEADARQYHLSYSAAISAIAESCIHNDIRQNPGISVKLSALHPRYEMPNRERVMEELVPRVQALALLAKSAGMGLNIDAEEADRLQLSLEVIAAVLSDPALKNWDGFGVVVQAYGLNAGPVLDWLYELAARIDRKIMVRLVKGAYWDTEIKRAQVLGLNGFPVFTRKTATDVSYISNARKLLGMRDRVYPQFATHNAHTVAAILQMAGTNRDFEFQRLHGMGENLHDIVIQENDTRCRIYAPVGAHRDLLAYLVRRLLENGANSSFVNQIVNKAVPSGEVAQDPFLDVEKHQGEEQNPAILHPIALYGNTRANAQGWDITDKRDVEEIEKARTPFRKEQFEVGPLIAKGAKGREKVSLTNPYDPSDSVGIITQASPADVKAALTVARPWKASAKRRAAILNKAANLIEKNYGLFFALAAREAGKSLPDAISELREAVDFIRFYANEALSIKRPPLGIIACISPWNFPLAIFLGQISAGLSAGNGVIAKPAEQTPIIGAKAIELMHQAGVPCNALQFLPGAGPIIGAAISSDPAIDGICFTGSTATARHINRTMAQNLSPHAPLIAETGGLNAMIVDSTALHEQAVRDILASAFQSAGQRCSALRILYVQEDIAEELCTMLYGAMDELAYGDPWDIATDVGPVIDQTAARHFKDYIEAAHAENRVLKQLPGNGGNNHIPPTVLKVNSIANMGQEIFGPVLHLATFKADKIKQVIEDINATGFGLTFGVHSRIDDRIQLIVDTLKVGNIYVNRNQIGAVVGSQPFGGEGLSGTGPKAGGPGYLLRLTKPEASIKDTPLGNFAKFSAVQDAINSMPEPSQLPLQTNNLPGPTGESNQLSTFGKGKILCLGPGKKMADKQANEACSAGCSALSVCIDGDVNGAISPSDLTKLTNFDAIVFWGNEQDARAYRMALAAREGAILPLITSIGDIEKYQIERHVCIDTTASGGNAELLAASDN